MEHESKSSFHIVGATTEKTLSLVIPNQAILGPESCKGLQVLTEGSAEDCNRGGGTVHMRVPVGNTNILN